MIYLIRHAEAGEAESDEVRHLTARGRKDASRLGKFLRGSGVMRGVEFWHSTLVRARETAEIVATEMGVAPAKLHEVAGFAPEDSAAEALRKIAAVKGDVAVFGHNPQLTHLAALLIKGEGRGMAAVFEKCAALALEKGGSGRPGDWFVCWHVAPELLKAA